MLSYQSAIAYSGKYRILSGGIPYLIYSVKREVFVLPNIKSAKKRVKVTSVKALRNKMFRSRLRTAIKKYGAAVAGGDKAAAQTAYAEAVKMIDRAGARGVVHKNLVARKKSQFTKALNGMK